MNEIIMYDVHDVSLMFPGWVFRGLPLLFWQFNTYCFGKRWSKGGWLNSEYIHLSKMGIYAQWERAKSLTCVPDLQVCQSSVLARAGKSPQHFVSSLGTWHT